MSRVKRRIIKCVACGEKYGQSDERDESMCPTCRWERKGRTAMAKEVTGVRIINDPLLPGGFAPGVYFTSTEVKQMLICDCFTDQTMVRSRGMLFIYSEEVGDFIKVVTKSGNIVGSPQAMAGRPRKLLLST